jgi:hypothetical protein
MSTSLFFWILMLIGLLLDLYGSREAFRGTPGAPAVRLRVVGNLFLWVILITIGWRVFGPPLHN